MTEFKETIEKLNEFGVENRGAILVVGAAVAVLGFWSRRRS